MLQNAMAAESEEEDEVDSLNTSSKGDDDASRQAEPAWSNVKPSYEAAFAELKEAAMSVPLRQQLCNAPHPAANHEGSTDGQTNATLLHEEILRFCNSALLSEREKAIRQQALEELERAVLELWPNARVQLFGSQATGLALPGSDVDIVVLGEHPARNEQQQPGGGFSKLARQRVCNILGSLSRHLRKRKIVKSCTVINARVPICKCVLTRGSLSCDLSLGAKNGANAVDFVGSLVHSLPPLRPLCLVLKAFLAQRNLNEPYTGGVGGWQLINMLYAHLQAEGIDTGQEVDLGACLQAFFKRFSHGLDFKKYALSIERGGIVRKSGTLFNRSRLHNLAIEDPQEPNKDIGGAIFNIHAVRRAFKSASLKLAHKHDAYAFAADNDHEHQNHYLKRYEADSEAAKRLWAQVQADSTHASVAAALLYNGKDHSQYGSDVMPILNRIMSTESALSRKPEINEDATGETSTTVAASEQSRRLKQRNTKKKEKKKILDRDRSQARNRQATARKRRANHQEHLQFGNKAKRQKHDHKKRQHVERQTAHNNKSWQRRSLQLM